MAQPITDERRGVIRAQVRKGGGGGGGGNLIIRLSLTISDGVSEHRLNPHLSIFFVSSDIPIDSLDS